MADSPAEENRGIVSQDSFQDPFETSKKWKSLDDEEETQKILFNELNFFTIPTQSNIYGLTSIRTETGTKLLLATLSGKIYSLSFNQQSMQSTLKAVSFSYIPALAEIISIDMFLSEASQPIVGVTLIIKKDQESLREVFFNIYGLHTKPSSDPDWERIAEDWQTHNLAYTPFLLTHTRRLVDRVGGCGSETMFLVSGDDCKVHVYRQISDEVGFREELPVEAFFPEFEELPSSVTCMDIVNTGQSRLTAFGCQNGYVRCCKVDSNSNCILWICDSTTLDGPITSTRLFRNHTHKEVRGIESFHLLVTSAIELGCIFMDVLRNELRGYPLVLPYSESYDSVLCSEVADINWNRQNEIILGTYGKKLLVYSLVKKEEDSHEVCLEYERQFAHPLHKILYCDVTGDGLNELVVLSTAGLHLLQHDLYQASQALEARITDTNRHSNKPTTTAINP